MTGDKAKIHLFIIALMVTITNLHAVFVPQVLVFDDLARFVTFFNDEPLPVFDRAWLGLGILIKWVPAMITAKSVEAARLFLLLVFMLPTSILFYLSGRYLLHLPWPVALASAIVMQIIPSLFWVPVFVDGSYVTYGTLFLFITVGLIGHYLKARKGRTAAFIGIVCFFTLAHDSLAELTVFLLPALVYLTYVLEGPKARKYRVLLVLVGITVIRLIHILSGLGEGDSAQPQHLPWFEILTRFDRTLTSWLPFPVVSTAPWALVVAILFSLLAFLLLRGARTSADGSLNSAWVFYGLWALGAGFPFWLLSEQFADRYLYVVYIGLTPIVLLLIHQLSRVRLGLSPGASVALLAAVVLVFAVGRVALNHDTYQHWNQEQHDVQALLRDENLDGQTQVVMINDSALTGGFHRWSSGYLQHALRIPGVTGLIGREVAPHDAFNLDRCDYRFTMSCLDVNKRLIAYRYGTRMRWFLRWIDAESNGSDWALYRSDDQDRLVLVSRGEGLEAYRGTRAELGLNSRDVLWGWGL